MRGQKKGKGGKPHPMRKPLAHRTSPLWSSAATSASAAGSTDAQPPSPADWAAESNAAAAAGHVCTAINGGWPFLAQ